MFGIDSQLRGLILSSIHFPGLTSQNLSVRVARNEAIPSWLCTDMHGNFPNNFRLSCPYDAYARLRPISLSLSLSLVAGKRSATYRPDDGNGGVFLKMDSSGLLILTVARGPEVRGSVFG